MSKWAKLLLSVVFTLGLIAPVLAANDKIMNWCGWRVSNTSTADAGRDLTTFRNWFDTDNPYNSDGYWWHQNNMTSTKTGSWVNPNTWGKQILVQWNQGGCAYVNTVITNVCEIRLGIAQTYKSVLRVDEGGCISNVNINVGSVISSLEGKNARLHINGGNIFAGNDNIGTDGQKGLNISYAATGEGGVFMTGGRLLVEKGGFKIAPNAGGVGYFALTNGTAESSVVVQLGPNAASNSGSACIIQAGGTFKAQAGITLNNNGSYVMDGGMLETGSMNFNARPGQSFTWGSGTIKATAANVFNMASEVRTVSVTGNPAVLNTGNYAQTLPADIAEGDGILKLTGGNTVTLSAMPKFGIWLDGTSLVFAPALGRTLSVASLKFENGSSVVLDADSLVGDDAISLTAAEGFSVPEGASLLDFVVLTGETVDDCKKTLSADGKTIMVSKGNTVNLWVGGASGNLSEAKNWLLRIVPSGGNAFFDSAVEANLTLGDTFSPDAITFLEGSAAVTISGDRKLSGLAAVTNFSDSVCTFKVPVEFVDEINVSQGAYYYFDNWGNNYEHVGGRVCFAGGVTGSAFANGTSRLLCGAFSIPVTSGWVGSGTLAEHVWTIPGDSSLSITGSTQENPAPADTSMLLINASGALTTGVMRISKRLAYRVHGEYVVAEELMVDLKSNVYIAERNDGIYKFEKLTITDDGSSRYFNVANSTQQPGVKKLYIGAGGIKNNGTVGTSTALWLGYDNYANNHDITHLYPWHSDYAISGKGGSTYDIMIFRPTYVHTDDECGVARTVTLDGIADIRDMLTVDGKGRFQVNSDSKNGDASKIAISGIAVADSATLAFAPGADLGAGALSVGSDATLEVSSGVNTFGGISLANGATLGFNFTDRRVAPQIAVAQGKIVTVSGAVKVKVLGDVWPLGGDYVLTACGGFDADGVAVTLAEGAPKWAKGVRVNDDGNIVLTVKPRPTMIIVR